MYAIKRFSRTKYKDFRQGWKELKDEDIWNECERVNDDILGRYNQKWIADPFKSKYIISKTDLFNEDFNSIEDKHDLDRINRLINDLKIGFLYVDNGNIKYKGRLSYNEAKYPDETHYLDKFSKIGEYLVYSKFITTTDRLTYKVYKPESSGNKLNIKVELCSCIGHKIDRATYYSNIY